MLIILGQMALGLAVSLGFGLLLLRMPAMGLPGLGWRALPQGLTIGDIGLLGLLGWATLATTVNLVLPLSRIVGGAILALGLLALLLALPLDGRRLRAGGRPRLPAVAATLALLGVMALRCASWAFGEAAGHYDTGLYHMQAIALAQEHPVIIGVGQIHMRFGYNAILFPLIATLAAAGSALSAAAAANSLLLLWTAMAVGERLLRRGAMAEGAVWIFGAALLYGLADWQELRSAFLGNPNTDIGPRLLIAYGVMLSLALATRPASPPGTSPAAATAADTLALMTCVVFAVTIKLSALPVVLLLLLPLLLWWQGALDRAAILACCALGAGVGLPWLLRGVMTSGCLAYPVAASCLPLPWRIAPAMLEHDVTWMRAWARQPNTPPEIALAGWGWLSSWLAQLPSQPMAPRLLHLAALALALGLLRLALPALPTPLARFSPGERARYALVLAVALVGLGFWFLTAPLLRYGVVWVIMPPLILVAGLLPWPRLPAPAGMPTRPQPLAVGAVALLVALGCAGPLRRVPRESWLAMPPGFPPVTLEVVDDIAGRPLAKPSRSGNQCWDAPLFCSPFSAAGRLEAEQVGPWLVVRKAAP